MLELDNIAHPDQEPFSMDEITSNLVGAQLLQLCEDELFQETLNDQNSDVASSSNCRYESNNTQIDSSFSNSNHQNNEIKQTSKSVIDASAKPPSSPTQAHDICPFFDRAGPSEQINQDDILRSIDFTTSPTSSILRNYHYNNNQEYNPCTVVSSLNNASNFALRDDQIDIDSVHASSGIYGHHHEPWPVVSAQPQPLVVHNMGYEDQCPPPLPSSIAPPSYISLRNNSSFMDPPIAPFLTMNPSFSAETVGVFNGYSSMLGKDMISRQELDLQGENSGGIFLQRALNFTNELQGLSSESQHLVHGGTSSTTTPLASDITSFDDPSFKVGKLSVEERQLKIHRYRMKRQERNFSKKIKYACRKTLADSRPRVRGRFAKNDELEELARINGCNQEDDGDDDIMIVSNCMSDHQRSVVVKDEDGMDSSDILAHLSGVNSFKCNYPIQSWI